MILNISNIAEFIANYTKISLKVNEEEEEDVSSFNHWENMGWYLWQVAEREKKILETNNQELADEIKWLRHKLKQLENQQKQDNNNNNNNNNNLYSLLAQVDSLMNKLIGSKDDMAIDDSSNKEGMVADNTDNKEGMVTKDKLIDITKNGQDNQRTCPVEE